MKKWLAGLSLRTVATLLAIAILAGVFLGVALAQVPASLIASPTGNEQINVLPPSTGGVITSPNIVSVTINQIRNSNGYTLVAAGTTVATQATNAAAVYLAIGAITTWNVTFPTAPEDGQMMKEGCPGGNVGTISNTATLPTGVTIVGAAFTGCTESSATDAQWHYNASGNIWYRSE